MLSGYSRGSREITAQSGDYGTTRSVRYSEIQPDYSCQCRRKITAQSGNYGAVWIFKGLSGIFASGQSGYSGVVNL